MTIEAADHEIATLGRRAEAAQLIVARRQSELGDALARYGDDWIENLQADYLEACRGWAKLCDQLASQASYLSALRALEQFALRGRYSGPSEVMPMVGQIPDNVTIDVALAAVRRFAKLPEPHASSEPAAA